MVDILTLGSSDETGSLLGTNALHRNDCTVYLYWTGPKYSLLIILEKLIYLHSDGGKKYKVVLITPDNIRDYIQIPDSFSKLSASDQSNYARINLMYSYGGIWLDIDTVVMGDLSDLFKLLETHEGFYMLENNTTLVAGVFGSRAKTKFMSEWKDRVDGILSGKTFVSRRTSVKWGEISSKSMIAIYNQLDSDNGSSNIKLLNGLDTIYPVNYPQCVVEYLEKPYENYKNIIRDFQPVVVLVRSVYQALQGKTVTEILSMNTPLNYFINTSIANLGLTNTQFLDLLEL